MESQVGSEASETFTLVTDVLDPAVLSAERAAEAYASRWQLETSLRGGAAVVLRSKTPDMIRQEVYAMLCCYQAIRVLISPNRGIHLTGLEWERGASCQLDQTSGWKSRPGRYWSTR